MHPSELRAHWREYESHGYKLPTVEFYGHTRGTYAAFSNFYAHKPFMFTVPEKCGKARLVDAHRPTVVPIEFSEKAIMLCKAAVMGDVGTYDKILSASNPREAKALGRCVSPWKQGVWDAVVCEVAKEVVTQKFAGVPGLAELLRSTGCQLIAESTRNDYNWGTGLDIGHADASRPWNWPGTNILGWALMQARATLNASARGREADGGRCDRVGDGSEQKKLKVGIERSRC